MAERIEALLLGLGNALGAAMLIHGVVRDEIGPGAIFVAVVLAWLAVAQAVRLALLSARGR
ncbi:MAG TPA: hypothetical protein VHO06_22345 [Polyangia bacterium]|nr:hypothetical protein [Polyangia bacterium]